MISLRPGNLFRSSTGSRSWKLGLLFMHYIIIFIAALTTRSCSPITSKTWWPLLSHLVIYLFWNDMQESRIIREEAAYERSRLLSVA